MSKSASFLFLGDGTDGMAVNACERRVTSFSDSMDIEGFCCLTAFVLKTGSRPIIGVNIDILSLFRVFALT